MILLQILDEGNITDSQGRKVDFKVQISLPRTICHIADAFLFRTPSSV